MSKKQNVITLFRQVGNDLKKSGVHTKEDAIALAEEIKEEYSRDVME